MPQQKCDYIYVPPPDEESDKLVHDQPTAIFVELAPNTIEPDLLVPQARLETQSNTVMGRIQFVLVPVS